ncbi:uncharacterized protein C9orf50 homolog [Sciurus carolinensis]|uniref:uncharacterized protein C9orf50 homolog n=1 Tax=Sciurus carolinensis TaxID=30640 RepID=UPI001FB295B9|nr:uncharacterized protein C9orf50 homolog [Sciurus carolinensis]
MFRRHPGRGPQQVAPKRCPGAGDRPRPQVLPKLPSPERRAGRCAGCKGCAGASGGSHASRAYSSWWQERDTKPRAGVRSPPSRLPRLHTVTSRATEDCAGLRTPLLPPLLSTERPRGCACRCPPPGRGQDPQRGVAEEDPLGALLGEFLPSRFREFLHQLQQKCAEQPEPQMSAAPRYQKCVFQPRRSSSQCHTCPLLSDLWGQPSHFQDNCRKISLHQIPSLSHQRGDPPQFTTGRNTNQLHSTQVPKAKAHNSSGEGLGYRRRCCPFRVRFADETLRDSTLRYLERRCAVPSNIKSRTTLLPALSDQVFGSIQKWLESLPKAVSPRAKEEARTSSWCWDCPRLFPQELQGYLSKDTSVKSRLPGPFIPRAPTQRQRGPLRTSLDTLNILDQVGRLPGSWRQKLGVDGSTCPLGRRCRILLAPGSPGSCLRPRQRPADPPHSRSPSCPTWCCSPS